MLDVTNSELPFDYSRIQSPLANILQITMSEAMVQKEMNDTIIQTANNLTVCNYSVLQSTEDQDSTMEVNETNIIEMERSQIPNRTFDFIETTTCTRSQIVENIIENSSMTESKKDVNFTMTLNQLTNRTIGNLTEPLNLIHDSQLTFKEDTQLIEKQHELSQTKLENEEIHVVTGNKTYDVVEKENFETMAPAPKEITNPETPIVCVPAVKPRSFISESVKVPEPPRRAQKESLNVSANLSMSNLHHNYNNHNVTVDLSSISLLEIAKAKMFSDNGFSLDNVNVVELIDDLKNELVKIKNQDAKVKEAHRRCRQELDQIQARIDQKTIRHNELKAKLQEKRDASNKFEMNLYTNKDLIKFGTFKDSDLENAQNGNFRMIKYNKKIFYLFTGLFLRA